MKTHVCCYCTGPKIRQWTVGLFMASSVHILFQVNKRLILDIINIIVCVYSPDCNSIDINYLFVYGFFISKFLVLSALIYFSGCLKVLSAESGRRKWWIELCVPLQVDTLRWSNQAIYLSDSCCERHKDCKMPHRGSVCDIPPDVEEEIVRLCLEISTMFVWSSTKKLKTLVFSVAERNHTPHRYDRKSKMAGEKCFYGFTRR